MFLTNKEISEHIVLGKIAISPFNSENLRVNSYDLSVGKIYTFHTDLVVDLSTDSVDLACLADENNPDYLFRPGSSIVIETLEKVSVANDIIGILSPRSKMARMLTYSYSLLVDSGYCGKLSICLVNNSTTRFIIKRGMRFAQILFANNAEVDIGYMHLAGSLNTSQQESLTGFIPDIKSKQI